MLYRSVCFARFLSKLELHADLSLSLLPASISPFINRSIDRSANGSSISVRLLGQLGLSLQLLTVIYGQRACKYLTQFSWSLLLPLLFWGSWFCFMLLLLLLVLFLLLLLLLLLSFCFLRQCAIIALTVEIMRAIKITQMPPENRPMIQRYSHWDWEIEWDLPLSTLALN